MFNKKTYVSRRLKLVEQLKEGFVFLPGNSEIAMNYASNPFRFRQDSNFLYYIGLDQPLLDAVVDLERNETILFGDDLELDDIIWMGSQHMLHDQANSVGINVVKPKTELAKFLRTARDNGKTIHYSPPYHQYQKSRIASFLNIAINDVSKQSSLDLIRSIINQRSLKSADEIEEIKNAQHIAYHMHTTAMQMAQPGIYEYEIAGKIEGIALAAGGNISFPVILSVHGEILHNHYHGNILREGHLVINDSGAENQLHYASDITRTFPAGGKFTDKQKDIYQIVLDSQLAAIDTIKPGIKFRDVHLKAARVITEGLKDLGLMKGNTIDAVQQGAHALFFPHGLGHMLGLDVHDMENLGEDLVGYDNMTRRSNQFGLAYLRLARELQPGFVLTVEPGIYFISALIEKWKTEGTCSEYVNFDQVEKYLDFGGIRIEDDILVTEKGSEVLGKAIPKTIDDVEEMCQS